MSSSIHSIASPEGMGLEPTYMNTLPQMKNANIAWICAPYCISTNRKMQDRQRVRKGKLQMHVHSYSSYMCKLSFI